MRSSEWEIEEGGEYEKEEKGMREYEQKSEMEDEKTKKKRKKKKQKKKMKEEHSCSHVFLFSCFYSIFPYSFSSISYSPSFLSFPFSNFEGSGKMTLIE